MNEINFRERTEKSHYLSLQKNANHQPITALKKSFWKEKKWAIMATIALSIGAIVFPFFCHCYLNNPNHNLLLDKADPNRKMATDIESFHQIAGLQQINGVDISLIEQRARPNRWSTIGFIGKEDRLLEVLQKDWKTVGALGTNHMEFADHLKSISDLAFNNYNEEMKGSISYDFNTLKGNTINKNRSSIKQFEIQVGPTQGWQNDIFDSCMTASEEFYKCNGTYGSSRTPLFWGTDLYITNPKNKEHVHVTNGTINYIRKYGFYESGDENYYRIDPIRLASVFTGHSYCSIAKAINQPCHSVAPRDPRYKPN